MRKILFALLLGCLPFLQLASISAGLAQASFKQHNVQNSPAHVAKPAPELQPDLLRYFIQ
jgi:hypothetical protein